MTFPGEQAQRSRAFTRSTGGGPLWQFFRGFLKHPAMVGSIIPSSRVLIDKMLDPVDWANCKVFVEYGPGVGTFTEHVLARMAPDAVLIAIDTNSDFVEYLGRKIRDSRPRHRARHPCGPPSRRRLPRLPVHAQGPAVHRAPFRANRPRLRMGEHPACDPVLGVEGLARVIPAEAGTLGEQVRALLPGGDKAPIHDIPAFRGSWSSRSSAAARSGSPRPRRGNSRLPISAD